MINFYCAPVNYDILNLAIHLTDGLAFMQGADLHVSPAEKANNLAATIQAIFSINHPEITLARVRATCDNQDPKYLVKDSQIIGNDAKSLRIIIDSIPSLSQTLFQRCRQQGLDGIFATGGK